MKWSVSVIAEGDREMSQAEVVELADAVAGWGGIASGIGTTHYGAQLVVEAEDRDSALAAGRTRFARAVATAGLPSWPITEIDAISEADDELGDLS